MAASRTIKLIVFNYGSSGREKDIRFIATLKTWHEKENFVGMYRAVRKEIRLSTGNAIPPEVVVDMMVERGYCKYPVKEDDVYIVRD